MDCVRSLLALGGRQVWPILLLVTFVPLLQRQFSGRNIHFGLLFHGVWSMIIAPRYLDRTPWKLEYAEKEAVSSWWIGREEHRKGLGTRYPMDHPMATYFLSVDVSRIFWNSATRWVPKLYFESWVAFFFQAIICIETVIKRLLWLGTMPSFPLFPSPVMSKPLTLWCGYLQMCWVAFIAVLGCMQLLGYKLDTLV